MIIGELCKHDKENNTLVLASPLTHKIQLQPWKVIARDGEAIKEQIQGAQTIAEPIQQLEPKYSDILGEIDIPLDQGRDIVTVLATGFLILASDRLIRENEKRGTYAYKLKI